MNSSLDEIFAETKFVVATETLAEVKECVEEVEEELKRLRAKTAEQDMEIALLKKELQHKEELLAVHNYYLKSRGIQ